MDFFGAQYQHVKTEYIVDGDDLHVKRESDAQPIIDMTSSLRSVGAVGSNEFRHAASFDAVVVEHYCNQNGITFNEWLTNPVHVKRMLADKDLKAFRVWEGRV